MISDPARGSAWAIPGIVVRELHSCAEEAAVFVVGEILRHTGDELVVNWYKRPAP
ncbi:hypothetical protein EDC04DRAFT_2518151, partial [Pisolithus marmoratus]